MDSISVNNNTVRVFLALIDPMLLLVQLQMLSALRHMNTKYPKKHALKGGIPCVFTQSEEDMWASLHWSVSDE